METSSVVRIGEVPYVTGLFWQLLSDREHMDAEAISLGAKLGFDVYAVDNSGDALQVGYGSSESLVKGARPLALDVQAQIRETGVRTDAGPLKPANWIAVFELSETRWYLIAVRAGAIIPSSDFVGDPDEVIQRVAEIQAIGGWEAAIGSVALQSLGIAARFAPVPLHDLLKVPARSSILNRLMSWRGGAFKPIKVAQSPAARRKQLLLGVVAVLGVSGLSVGGWLAYQQHLAAEAMHLAAQAEEEQRRLKKPVVPEWATRPSVRTFLDICLSHYVLTRSGGWELEEFSCDGKEVLQSWGRRDGSTVQLVASDPGTEIDKQFEKAKRRIPLSPLRESGSEHIGWRNPAVVDLVSVMQALGIQFQIAAEADVSVSLAGNRRGVKNIQFKSTISEMDPRAYMQMFPYGTRLKKLTWKSGGWELEGDIYVAEHS